MLSLASNVDTPTAIQLLIVEDEPTLALALQETLESLGYIVLGVVDSAIAAIETAAARRPNLVLMDIELQGEIDGIHAAEEIWNQLHIPVIYLSKQADKRTLDRAALTVSFGYLLQPVTAPELYVAIQTALNRYHREQFLALEHTRQLDIQRAEMQKMQQLKENFLAMTSHELRTPLSNIKLAIRLLETVLARQDLSTLQDQTTAQALDRYLTILRDQCDQGLNTVNDLLDIRSIDADEFPLELMPIQLEYWLPHLIEVFQAQIQVQLQSLQITVFPNLPALVSDLSVLTRIISELVSRACSYTPAGGQINVSAQPLTVSQPSAIQAVNSEWMQLQISNSGDDIPLNEQAHIFEPFYRIPQNDQWKYGGTGLGLALVKKLVEHLMGTIEVTSESGWTIFTLRLPLNASPEVNQ